MRLMQQISKTIMLGLVVVPFLITSCNKDDDSDPKPAKGEANLSAEGSSVSLPEKVAFSDESNYEISFDDTVDQALIIEGENDSATIELTFFRNSGSGKIQSGEFDAESADTGGSGVDVSVSEGGQFWSSYSVPFNDDDLGSVEIKSRSDDNVYCELKDVKVRKGNNTTESFTINGFINAEKK